MMKKVLPLAIAAAMMSSFAHADVKLSGTIQAEVGSLKDANTVDANGNRVRRTITDSDITGNGSPNRLKLDIAEKLGSGIDGFASMDWEFDTFEGAQNSPTSTSGANANFINREKYVGIKHTYGHLKLGRIQGIYKTSTLSYDKWNSTSLQARGTGAGMSSGAFGHGGFLDNVVEIGGNIPVGPVGSVKATLQYLADQTADATTGLRNDGSILGALQLGNKEFELSLVGAQQRNKDKFGNDAAVGSKLTNWKVAGQYKLGGLYFALQYEKVKTAQSFGIPIAGTAVTVNGVATGNVTDPTEFVWGGLGYRVGAVELFGWAGGTMKVKDLKDTKLNDPSGKSDIFGYSVGAMYHFSKNMFAYAGYHKTDDKRSVDHNNTQLNDKYDSEVFLGGLRLNF
jgi:predicted porin